MFDYSRKVGLFAMALLAPLAITACGGGEADGDAGAEMDGQEASSMESMVDPATAATITGNVAFQGTAPEPESIDMAEEPTCAEKYADVPMTEKVVVNDNGTLANVFVYVKSGLPEMSFPTPSEPVVLDQDGCRYRPHVFGIQAGQTLAIRNSDGILHNINAKPSANRGFNISQPREMTTEREFRVPEIMIPVECDVHGWMNAFVGVLDHPYFDTTGNQGSFGIGNLPPGTYTIEAWHEVYGTQTQEVTVGASESAEVTFTFGEAAA